jgi:hypothetical protein
MTTSSGSETVLLAEELPDGTRREWLMASRRFTEEPAQRAEIVTAIEEMHWQRPNQDMPMSPALLLQNLIAQMDLKRVGQVGYSIHEIRYQDCNCKHRDENCHPDHWASYSVVGIKVRQDSWWTLYFLDIGVGAVWLISDITDAPIPANVSVRCALEWHDECPGTFPTASGRATCECAHPAHEHSHPNGDRTEFLSDVLSTALEGGVNYWSVACDIEREGDYPKGDWYYTGVTLFEDADGDKHCSQKDEECQGHRVDLDGVARAVAALSHDPKWRHHKLLAEASREKDAGNVDSDVADDVVQFAALGGSIVYG